MVTDAVRARRDVVSYSGTSSAKAAALDSRGRLFIVAGGGTQRAAEEKVLAECNADPERKNDDGQCLLYAAGEQVVLSRQALAPVSAVPTGVTPGADLRTKLLEQLRKVARSGITDDFVDTYIRYSPNKALAASPTGGWRERDQPNAAVAEQLALEGCEVFYGVPCALIAVNDTLQSDSVGAVPKRMSRVHYDGLFDPQKIPVVRDSVRVRPDVSAYGDVTGGKAAALHPIGARFFTVTGASSQRQAEEKVLTDCNADTQRKKWNGPCFLYAIGNRVVLGFRSTAPATAVIAAAAGTLREELLKQVAKVASTSTTDAREQQVRLFIAAASHKALAGYVGGTWRATDAVSPGEAEERALEGCQSFRGEPCILLIVDDTLQPSDALDKPRPMPRVAYSGDFDPQKIPATSGVQRRKDVAAYSAAAGPKAVAYHPWGRLFIVTGAASQRAAEEKALADCNADPQRNKQNGPCFLYAIDNQVVLPRRLILPETAPVVAPPVAAAASVREQLLAVVAKVAPLGTDAALTQQISAYLDARTHKALAGFHAGTWRATTSGSAFAAEERALETCQVFLGEPCVLLAVDDAVQSATVITTKRSMARATYQGPFLPERIPAHESVKSRADVVAYRTAQAPKAAAYHPWGRLFIVVDASSQREAEQKALDECNADPQRNKQDGPCFLYAAGNQVVLPRRQRFPIATGK